MKITTILFDLDGTLLPMDQDAFIRAYFGRLAAKLAPLGYESDGLFRALWAGISAMVKNDGSRTNEDAFWATFCGVYGEKALADKPHFDAFYRNEFQQVQQSCGFAPQAAPLVRGLKAQGYRVALATNPLFPAVATESRVRWAGLEPQDFELVTTYENASFCKPNPAYYSEIIGKLGVSAGECLMVGNDATEDLAAAQLGMRVFLLTPCLINKQGTDLSAIPHGDFEALSAFLAGLNRA